MQSHPSVSVSIDFLTDFLTQESVTCQKACVCSLIDNFCSSFYLTATHLLDDSSSRRECGLAAVRTCLRSLFWVFGVFWVTGYCQAIVSMILIDSD